MSQARIKIAVIEPSIIVQLGLQKMLDCNSKFEITHSFSSFQTFQETDLVNKPDIILVNPQIISLNKRYSIRTFIDFPETIIMAIVYSYIDSDTLNSFDGSIDLYDERNLILKKIEYAATSKSKRSTSVENIELSDREKEILVSIAVGLMNKEIAEKYFISVHTVMSHRKNIIRKTGIKTVSGLTMYALFNGLISPSDSE